MLEITKRVSIIFKLNFMSANPFILLLAKTNPAVYDVVFPHGPKYSKGDIDVFASQILKSISMSLENRQTGKVLCGLAKQVYALGFSAMSYDDDNFYGTHYPIHHINFDPEPNPWFEGRILKQDKQAANLYYGGIISIVSQVVSDQKIAAQLSKIGSGMMGQK